MKKSALHILFISLIILAACSTGKQALKHGNYHEAVLQAIGRLRQNTDSKDATAVLKKGYPLAIEDSKRKIDRSIAGTDPMKWNTVYQEMTKVNNLADEIYHCPAALNIIQKPMEYQASNLDNAKAQAVKELYQEAKSYYDLGGRENAKIAITELERLLVFEPGHTQANQLLQQAIERATLKIVVELLPYEHKKYDLSDLAFRNEINSHLAELDRRYPYIRIYTPEQAEKANLKPDQVISVDWVNFNVGNTNNKQIERTVTSADSVKIGETTVNGVVYPVYNKVSAKLNINIMEIISNGKMIVQAKDFQTQRVLSSQTPVGSYSWHYEWGSYNGDERALTKEELSICKNKPPVLPSPQFLFTELTKPLYDQVASWFDSHMRKYK